MNISLTEKKVSGLVLKPAEKNKAKGKKQQLTVNLKISNQVFGNSKNKALFRVRYNVEMNVEGELDLTLNYDFDFKADEDIDHTVISRSPEILSHAPTVAYPYIKVFTENLLYSAGYEEIKLPFVDFINNPLEQIKK